MKLLKALCSLFPGRPAQSNTVSTSFGGIKPDLKSLREDKYSAIQLGELKQCRVERGIRTTLLSAGRPILYAFSYRALLVVKILVVVI